MMKKIWILVATILLYGCFASTPNSQFYLLESTGLSEEVSARKINLAVSDVFVPEYIDRPQIVLQKPDSAELSIAEFNRWASDLNTMLQNTLITDLQNALPNAEIKPLAYGDQPRYVVKLNIEKLSGWLGQKAYLSGNWQVLNTQSRIVFEQNFSFSENAGKTYDQYVQAQSLMLGRVASDISKKISTLK